MKIIGIREEGITIMELLVTIIIIAILAAIAIPTYNTKVERTRGERAIANVELILDAFKIYRVKYQSYPTPNGAGYGGGGLHGLDYISQQLGLELSDSNFDYLLAFPGETEWALYTTITATRNSGNYSGDIIRYEYDENDGDPDRWHDTSDWPWMP